MTDLSTASTGRSGTSRAREARGGPVGRFFGTIGLFIRQVLDELGKVVRPTREELLTYTAVVITFVSVMMVFVFGLDRLFTWLVGLVFGSSA